MNVHFFKVLFEPTQDLVRGHELNTLCCTPGGQKGQSYFLILANKRVMEFKHLTRSAHECIMMDRTNC